MSSIFQSMGTRLLNIFIACLLSVCLFACNKETDESKKGEVVGNFWMSRGLPASADFSLSVAFFVEDPNVEFRGPSILVDSVTVNGRSLALSQFGIYELPTPDTAVFIGATTWKVAGANGISSFSHTMSDDFPEFHFALPAGLKKDSGLTLTLLDHTLQAKDSACVWLSNDSLTISHAFSNATWNTHFSAAELSKLSKGDMVYIEVRGCSRDSVTVNGMTFRFFKQQIKSETRPVI